MITKNKINEIVIKNLAFAKKVYEEQKELDSMIFVQVKDKNKKNLLNVIDLQGTGLPENKQDMFFDLGVMWGIKKMKKEISEIDAIFILSEAWFSVQDKKDVEKDGFKMPSKDPKRMECILSAGLAEDGKGSNEVFEIFKKWNGDKIKVEFKNLNDKLKKSYKNEPTYAESPLLKHFWKGVEMISEFKRTLPKELELYVEESTGESLYEMIINDINLIRQN